MSSKGEADLFASIRPALAEYSGQIHGSRVLDDRFGADFVGFATPKGRAQLAAYISEFLEMAKQSGIVQKALKKSGRIGEGVSLIEGGYAVIDTYFSLPARFGIEASVMGRHAC